MHSATSCRLTCQLLGLLHIWFLHVGLAPSCAFSQPCAIAGLTGMPANYQVMLQVENTKSAYTWLHDINAGQTWGSRGVSMVGGTALPIHLVAGAAHFGCQ